MLSHPDQNSKVANKMHVYVRQQGGTHSQVLQDYFFRS